MRKVQQTPIATVRSRYPEAKEKFEQRRIEEGYESRGEYFFWLGLYDLLLRRPHHVTAHLAHLSPERQEAAVLEVLTNFDRPEATRPGALFEQRLSVAAQEETWRLHAEVRELRERVRELEYDLERERAQGKLTLLEPPQA